MKDEDKLPSYDSTPLQASCHCKSITITIPNPPTSLNECQCSICRRYGAIWAYYPFQDVLITAEAGTATAKYMWGDRDLEFHRCNKCGCVTHWWPADKSNPTAKMGVNSRMFEPEVVSGVEKKVTKGPEQRSESAKSQ